MKSRALCRDLQGRLGQGELQEVQAAGADRRQLGRAALGQPDMVGQAQPTEEADHEVGQVELPPAQAVKRFLKRYPKVDLLLSYLKDSEVYQAVLDERLDLGMVGDPRPHPHLTVTPFTTERIVLAVPPKHSWARKRKVSLEQLNGQPFILLAHDGSTMKDLLRQARVRVKIVHLLDNVEIVKRAVEVGSGVALVPQVAVADEARVGRLKALDLAEGPIERAIGVLARKGAALSVPAQKFVQTLLSPKARAGNA